MVSKIMQLYGNRTVTAKELEPEFADAPPSVQLFYHSNFERFGVDTEFFIDRLSPTKLRIRTGTESGTLETVNLDEQKFKVNDQPMQSLGASREETLRNIQNIIN